MFWYIIDRIVECDPGKTIKALKSFTRSESFFQHHFVNYPVVPGVLQIEMIAQAGGKCIKVLDQSYAPALASVKKAKFYQSIFPGDQCIIEAEIKQLTPQYARCEGVVYVDGDKKASAEILYSFLPPEITEKLAPDEVVLQWLNKQKKE